jgi:LacI family transcriptional regulator, repressor for deo operon, udp, cdd, tsx, nupC, and nupG
VTRSKVTISDVAREAGVSIATVSRVMHGKVSVSAELAGRVRAVAHSLGYRPSPVARGLATGETGMVGVLVPELDNPHFHEVIKAIGAGAGQEGYRMLILESEGRAADEPDLAASLYDHADGVILCSPRMPDDRLHQLAAGRPRLLCVNRIPTGIGLPFVAFDSYSPMLEICGLLGRLGHHRVAYLSGPMDSWANAERWRAVAHAAAFGLEPIRVQAGYTIEAGYDAVDEALGHGATALIAANDLCAIGALSRLRDKGVRVPQDVSLTGFDDIPFAQRTVPPLTTARILRPELGMQAWRLMQSILAGEPALPSQPLLATEVIVRDSTGPLAGTGTEHGGRP